jgi:tol-pal system-associated acyl-CoA thioesterase
MASSGADFRLSLRVYIEDTDAGGIVYYVNYLKFMERARTEFMRQRGFGKRVIFERQHMFVVHRIEVDYRLPATLDDELIVSALPVRIGRAFIDFQQQVFRGDALLCDAVVRVVCVKKSSMKPTAMAQDIRASLTTQQLIQQAIELKNREQV